MACLFSSTAPVQLPELGNKIRTQPAVAFVGPSWSAGNRRGPGQSWRRFEVPADNGGVGLHQQVWPGVGARVNYSDYTACFVHITYAQPWSHPCTSTTTTTTTACSCDGSFSWWSSWDDQCEHFACTAAVTFGFARPKWCWWSWECLSTSAQGHAQRVLSSIFEWPPQH